MFTYSVNRNGQLFTFSNRKMALAFVQKGWIVNVYKNGKKIYTMYPIDKNDQK